MEEAFLGVEESMSLATLGLAIGDEAIALLEMRECRCEYF